MMLNTDGADSGGVTAILNGGMVEFWVSPGPSETSIDVGAGKRAVMIHWVLGMSAEVEATVSEGGPK